MPPPRVPAPFRRRDGRLWLEDVALDELAAAREGRAAWLLGHAAVLSALARARRAAGGVLSVPVGRVGPREILALAAAAGDWARITSRHELELARLAGFPPGRTVVACDVAEDGLLVDALSAGLPVIGPDPDNVARIAAALGLPAPPPAAPPPELPSGALRRVGGLLAPLLQGPPDLVLDAGWKPEGRAVARVLPVDATGEPRQATLRGLPEARPTAARLAGEARRGGWVVVADGRAAGVLPPDAAHPLPELVMVRGSAWRPLDARAWPSGDRSG